MSKNELYHHGVKGMRWGKWNEETARRYLGGEKIRKTPEERGFYKLATGEFDKRAGAIRFNEENRDWVNRVINKKDKDAKWAIEAMSGYAQNYNAAATTVNKYLLPAINNKWKDVNIDSDDVALAKYNKEVEDAFNEALNSVGNYRFYNSPSNELLIGYSIDLSGDTMKMPAIHVYSRNKKDVRDKKEDEAYNRALNRFNNDLDKLSDEFYKKHNLPDDYDLSRNPKLLDKYNDFIMNEKYSEYMNEELSKVH